MTNQRHHAAHPASAVKANLDINKKPNPAPVEKAALPNPNPSLGPVVAPRTSTFAPGNLRLTPPPPAPKDESAPVSLDGTNMRLGRIPELDDEPEPDEHLAVPDDTPDEDRLCPKHES
jgi:hypothetical protein